MFAAIFFIILSLFLHFLEAILTEAASPFVKRYLEAGLRRRRRCRKASSARHDVKSMSLYDGIHASKIMMEFETDNGKR